MELKCCKNKLNEKEGYASGGFASPGFEYFNYYFIDGGKAELKDFDNNSSCPFCGEEVRFQFMRLITEENKYA